MYIGNALLLVLNLPLIGLWVKVLKIPYWILFPLILLFCLIGAYSVSNSIFDLYVMLLFGVMGYLMKKYQYEGSTLVLAYVLGPMLEKALRQSLLMSEGSFTIFVTRPISAVMLGVALLVLLSAILPYLKKQRQKYEEYQESAE